MARQEKVVEELTTAIELELEGEDDSTEVYSYLNCITSMLVHARLSFIA